MLLDASEVQVRGVVVAVLRRYERG
jgi:hypothetical protein